jgi:glycosyltransferase involved in cell wall biosynthesis
MANSYPLKITYVLPVYWPAVGGCELHTHEVVKRLSGRHDIRVLTLIDNQQDKLSHDLWSACILRAPSEVREYMDHEATVSRLPLTLAEKWLTYPLARMQSPKLSEGVVKFLMERLSNFYMGKLIERLKDSDLIHCVHGGVSFLGYASYKASRLLGIPFIYTPVLHLYQKDWMKEIRKRKNGTQPLVYNPTLHLSPRAWTDHYWHQLCGEADALIAMTDFEKSFFVGNGISGEKVHRLGVGPLISEDPAPEFLTKHDLNHKKFVLFLGRNVETKGLEELLMAAHIVWKECPDVYFFFAGPKEGNSVEIFEQYEDPRISVLGQISEQEKAALLNSCDVFCMPSREESLGGTFLEAWKCGKPIIGAKIPPVMELNREEKGGFLVNPIPEEIAEKIIVLFRQPELARRMGEWGRDRVSRLYSWDVITEKLEAVYTELLNGNKSGESWKKLSS